ncbi:hypothetical protein N0V93_009477 [Gnomoniopsis smithogilvyi]|uniref:FAS1 domain-containing protein n=1 Tax=Gnomoniopsis smithogilvyi TaxID=1191159 RepID=A0A9W9CTU3_9PEZI|nr:hypothetical protein N0V93_009477 [Gnomoniopsis smithogilvyi]
MPRNISVPWAALILLALVGTTSPSSEHVNHLLMRQRPAGPANSLPEVLESQNYLSKYASLLELLAPIDSAFEKETDFDIDNENQIVPLLQYHILKETILTDDLQVVEPHFPPTMLLNETWTNITGGQRVTLMRQDEDEVFLVSGLDSRSMIDYQNRDIHFFEGVIQPIDTLLVPPMPLAETIRGRIPSMSAFLGALYKTGLADEVMDAKDVTIFAPDSQAFQKTYGALSELSNVELRNVLAYHIVPNRVLYSSDLQHQGQFLTRATLDDKTEPINITITAAGNHRYIGSSAVLDPDIMIANGVVHIITDVLNPLIPDAQPDPARKIQSPVFGPRGNATTGKTVPTPYLSDLPCITDCAATEMTAGPARTLHTPHPPTMRAAAVKCTGLPGVKAVVGIGMLAGIL